MHFPAAMPDRGDVEFNGGKRASREELLCILTVCRSRADKFGKFNGTCVLPVISLRLALEKSEEDAIFTERKRRFDYENLDC